MKTIVDKTGRRFGRLVVLRMMPRAMYEPVLAECLCDCGNMKVALASRLGSGTSSCGCLRVDVRRARPIRALADRFWDTVALTGDASDCWDWTGAIDPATGYGRVGHAGRVSGAHRASYELAFGFVPDGKLVCHTCDNRRCVNPNHLYAGTHSDNIKDAYRRGQRQKKAV